MPRPVPHHHAWGPSSRPRSQWQARRQSPRQVALCLTLFPPRAAAQHPSRCASHNSNHPPGHRGSKLTQAAIATGSGSSTFERRKSCPGFPRPLSRAVPGWSPAPLSVDYGGQGWSNVDAALGARGPVGFSSVDCRGCRAGLPAASPRCPGEG